MSEKLATTYKRPISNIKRKLASLVRIVFGRIFICERIVLLETRVSKVYFKKVNEAKVEIRLLQSSDVPKLDKFEKFRGGKAEERLKAGHLCFIAEENGDIVNYTWVSFNEAFVDELELKMRLSPSSAYQYDEYTVPKYRGKGILPAVLTFAGDYLFQNGIREIYELVASNNYSSLRAHKKIGSRKMGEVTFIRFLNSRRYRCKGETAKDYARLREMLSV
jgi:RimJ/RimL family protein N-acetyltransferase